MQGRKTYRINAYLNPDRAGDRVLLAKLRADRSRGVAISELVRQALNEHYMRPTPPTPAPELATLADAVAALVEQVTTLQAEAQRLAAENAELRLALHMAAFGDKQQRQIAAGHAARALARAGVNNGQGQTGT